MRTRTLGRSGIEVGPLALGGNVFGWTIDEAASFRILDGFVAGGLNLIDTALPPIFLTGDGRTGLLPRNEPSPGQGEPGIEQEWVDCQIAGDIPLGRVPAAASAQMGQGVMHHFVSHAPDQLFGRETDYEFRVEGKHPTARGQGRDIPIDY